MPKAVGIDLGTTNSVVSVLEAGEPVVIPERRGEPDDPVRCGLLEVRRGARRGGREEAGDHQPGPDHQVREAPHGHVVDHRHRREEVHAPRRSPRASCRS